jgi:sugar lactone lactonase YvrE
MLRPLSPKVEISPINDTSVVPVDPAPGATTAVNEVMDIAVARDDSLWAATGGGIVQWDVATETATIHTTAEGLPANRATRIAVGPDGVVWAGDSGWVARFDGAWEIFSAPPGLDGPAMVIDDHGALWGVGGENDLFRFDGAEWQMTEVPNLGGVGEWSASLAVGTDGALWAATNMNAGLLSFDGASWTNHGEDLPPGFAFNVAVAADGSIWAGSEAGDSIRAVGVARFDGDAWTVFTEADGLLANVAWMAAGSGGSVWAIHPGGGLSRFESDSWTTFEGVAGNPLGATVDSGGILWMPAPISSEDASSGIIGFDGARTTRLVIPVAEAPTTTTTTSVAPLGAWDPILATTRAKPTPPAATCPPGTDPTRPGPADQRRPQPGYIRNNAAAFDSTRGRVIYADALGDTWAFDICTNTWIDLEASGVIAGDAWGGLVYDVDSDRIIGFDESISIYDPETNAWTQAPNTGTWVFATGVYDPVSGLVVVEDDETLKAFDVDTASWTTVGALPEEPGPLLGYSVELDRLIFMRHTGTLLIDPRSGAATELDLKPPPMAGGFATLIHAVGSYGAHYSAQDRRMCGFDSASADWECWRAAPTSTDGVLDAMVFDPVNGRLLTIGLSWGGWEPPEIHTDPVWALDVETGEWSEILAPSDP